MIIDWRQIVGLFVLAIPIACVARTVVFEEVFREPREWCQRKSTQCRALLSRKFYYLFTCEYCFSHYVALLFLVLTHFKLLFPDWRGYVISLFSLVFVANIYLNLYGRVRLEITGQKKEIEARQKQIEVLEESRREHPKRGVERWQAGEGEKVGT